MIADRDEARAEAAPRQRRRPAVRRGRRSTPRTPPPSRPSPASTGATHVLNAVDPRFVMPVFDGAFAAGADYLDMAMSLSGRTRSGRTS